MSSEGSAALGAWEDRPKRNFEADPTGVQLGQREVFLLTRLDGLANIAEMCAMSGFGEEDTLSCLATLLVHGLIEIERAEGVRSLIKERTSDGRRRLRRRARQAAEEDPRLPDFAGVAPEDEAWLRRLGPLGHVPGQPFAKPGEGRYGGYQFDTREILKQCDLSVPLRREIIFLAENLQFLDHFEFFGVDPTKDRRTLKKAYFGFSRKFHPDTFFRKNTGPFGDRLEAIYRHGTDVHDALAEKEDLRDVYLRAVEARNLHYLSGLEAERAMMQARTRRRKLAEAEGRKLELAARLERTKKARRGRSKNPIREKLERAKTFYDEGMAHYDGENFLQAASSLKLAMTFDPDNELYARAHERVHEKANQVRADVAWKAGNMEESIGRTREALPNYLRAVDYNPRPDYCAHTANLVLRILDDAHRAVELAEMAVRGDPQNVDYLLLLGRICTQVDLVKKARATYERVLALEPKHEEAKKAVKALKRM